MLSDLLTRVREGALGSVEVLCDYLLEQGVPRHLTTELVHGLLLGEVQTSTGSSSGQPHPFTVVRPFAYYDTVEVVPPYRMFFHDLGIVKAHETNCVSPRRLPLNTAMKLRRVSLSLTTPDTLMRNLIEGSVELSINRQELLVMPVGGLLAFGPWGYPVLHDVSDGDDIRARVWLNTEAPHARLRLSLHGWLREPLGF